MSQTLDEFESWSPNPPTIEGNTNHSVTLSWTAGAFTFLQDQLIYIIQKKEKIPSWITVYSGGKTASTIDNLAPTHPHVFRLRIALKPCEKTVCLSKSIELKYSVNAETKESLSSDTFRTRTVGHGGGCRKGAVWSQWSAEAWARTDSCGTTAACFCMAVRCSYIKQVQQMLEERPILLSAINSSTGLTPLATAVIKGDVIMTRLLLDLGADLEQCSGGGRTPLQLAVLAGHCALAELLMDQRADIQARDINGLRVEHHAVDSGDLETLRLVLDRGDVTVRDNNGWTPLFRAVCQGSSTELIEELLLRGSPVEVTDRAGLTLLATARLLKDKHGRRRESVLRLVDTRFQHEKALANFTRLTSKISSVQALLNKLL